jgi:predicted GH43/DUF377 family glycosyl hydrolase
VVLLFSCEGDLFNTALIDESQNFTRYAGNPVMLPSTGWESTSLEQPCVIHDGSLYRMWYIAGNGVQNYMGYATSSDGITWNRYASNPVWTGNIQGVSVVVESSSSYKMYYHESGDTGIRLATSSNGLSWTAQGVVLSAGSSGTWEDTWLASPCVIRESDGTYKMWYSGHDGSGYSIGLATSSDGVSWTKYSGNPVFTVSSTGWDNINVTGASVFVYNGKYYMYYNARKSTTNLNYIGLATSDDGITFTRYGTSPLIDDSEAWVSDVANYGVYHPCAIVNEGKVHMWYKGTRSDKTGAFGYAYTRN